MKKYFAYRKDIGQVISYSDSPNEFSSDIIDQIEEELTEEDLELREKGYISFQIEGGKLVKNETRKKIMDEKKERLEKLKETLLEKKDKNEKFSDVEIMDFLLQIL